MMDGHEFSCVLCGKHRFFVSGNATGNPPEYTHSPGRPKNALTGHLWRSGGGAGSLGPLLQLRFRFFAP
jgi:hypothetical protein